MRTLLRTLSLAYVLLFLAALAAAKWWGFTPIADLVQAVPAQAQTFTVPQCEKQATETDTAVQKYLKLPKAQQTSDADADATEEVTSFDDFCIKAYMCPAFEPWWGEERGTLTDLDNYKGKPDWFAKAFAELRKTCPPRKLRLKQE